MKSRTGWYFRAKRLAQGLTVESVAAQLRYRNLRKGVHRLPRFEHDGIGSDKLFIGYTLILGLDYKVVLKLVEQDAESNPSFFWRDRLAWFTSYCVQMGITLRPARRHRGRKTAE